ncbi:MAG TPA: hypothetical protein VGN32_10690, partial [Ktedonobacterales bacterium]|nr:hypothetical protein [Ktedonobacterales bacterium]
MCAYRYGADGQARCTFEDRSDALYLGVERAAQRGGERVERFHSDVEVSARAALVPDPSDRPADEQHREVSSLAASQSALGGAAWEEQLA